METKDFWCTRHRHLKQAHEGEPRMVRATPDRPIKVTMPKYYTRDGELVERMGDADMVPVEDNAAAEKPPELLDSHPVKKGEERRNLSTKVDKLPEDPGERAGSVTKKKKGRAADQ